MPVVGCEWDIAWVGRCGEPTPSGIRYCAKHTETCVCCNKRPANRDCDASVLGLVCGAPLCDQCHHLGWVHVHVQPPTIVTEA